MIGRSAGRSLASASAGAGLLLVLALCLAQTADARGPRANAAPTPRQDQADEDPIERMLHVARTGSPAVRPQAAQRLV